jgi:hypothetical protein
MCLPALLMPSRPLFSLDVDRQLRRSLGHGGRTSMISTASQCPGRGGDTAPARFGHARACISVTSPSFQTGARRHARLEQVFDLLKARVQAVGDA